MLDTSVVIDLDRLLPSQLPARLSISAITLAELSAGPDAAHDATERVRRQQRVQFVEAAFVPIPFGQQEARAFAGVAASLRASGRKRSVRAFDALIAAAAITSGLPIYTCNPSDFEQIDGLVVRSVDLDGE